MHRSYMRSLVRPAWRWLFACAAVAAVGMGGPCSYRHDLLTYETTSDKTFVYNNGQLLAVYNHAGNTFTDFWVNGVNLIGGFDGGAPGTTTNSGSPIKGHSPEYPFGHRDANGNMLPWEGFWSGFNYMDKRWMVWTGVPGNGFAQASFSVDQSRDDLVTIHVVTVVPAAGWPDPLFQCQVDYFVSPRGIGVKNVVTIFKDLQPLGPDDTGGQLIMTQVECDLDPAQPYAQGNQPDLYYQLACNNSTVPLNPFPPYNAITPSNIYSDQNVPSPPADPSQAVHPIPNTSLVPAGDSLAYISPIGRPSRDLNLAPRVDLVRSSLPPLEYYCEYNGERDYLNLLLSPAIGGNRAAQYQTVLAGTQWILYGDLMPWWGTDPSILRDIAWLYE